MTRSNRHESPMDGGDTLGTRTHQFANDQFTKQYTSANRYTHGTQRTNEAWVRHLKGASGLLHQRDAHEDLSRYLFVVIFNYLQSRRNNLIGLSLYADDEIAVLAQDFVQSFMEKLVKDNYSLLRKYKTVGKFTSWAAQVTLNLVSTEFRRACWSRQLPMIRESYLDRETVHPDVAAVRTQIREVIDGCLKKLPEHYRIALVRCIAEDARAADVAEEMELTPNAVYILVHRAKAAMRSHLIQEGIDPQTLSVYAD
ncbi:MAG: sigma-70 family RNA polymerase sigma factor [Chloroflexota bacterium]